MSIKNVKPTKNSGFSQGYFKPNNPEKYAGTPPIIYRSSWERKFMIWCDNNDKIITWSSEPVEIPYWSRQDSKKRKYYPDFYFKAKQIDGTYKQYIVEIKPKAQLQKPKEPKRKTVKALKSFKYAYESYVRNLCKTNALNQMAKERNCKVMLLTEDSNLF